MTEQPTDRFSAEQARLLKLTGWRKPLTISQRERLRLGALASLQVRNAEARVIRGARSDSRGIAELLAQLNALLPEEMPALRVQWIDGVHCPECGKKTGVLDPATPALSHSIPPTLLTRADDE